MRAFYRSLLLPVLVLSAVAAFELWYEVETVPRDLLLLAARTAFALTFLLAWRFARGRSAWAVVLLAAYGELQQRATSDPADISSLAVAQWLLPLALAANAWSQEFALLSRVGARRWLLLGGLVTAASPAVWSVIQKKVELERWETLTDHRIHLAAFSIAAVLLVLRLAQRSSPLEAGWLASLVAIFIAMQPGHDPLLWWVASGVVLTQALVEGAFTLAFQDGLTGLPGRRALDERLSQLTGTYAIAMMDLDHFKRLNDRYGHEVGDQVLRWVAGQLRSLGGGGLAYRYGGEEFTILFPGRSLQHAKPHLEALRKQIAAQPFTLRAPDRPKRKPKGASNPRKKALSVRVTASFGLAERGKRRPPKNVLEAADKALYRAKKAGRNRLAVTQA